MVCPFCGSGNIIRKGYDKGRQRFYCKECRRHFIEKVKHRRNYPKDYKIRVVNTALRVGFSEASRIFGHPRATIYRWMKELHEEIKDELDKIKKGKLRRKY